MCRKIHPLLRPDLGMTGVDAAIAQFVQDILVSIDMFFEMNRGINEFLNIRITHGA